jgi:hypothetical protein
MTALEWENSGCKAGVGLMVAQKLKVAFPAFRCRSSDSGQSDIDLHMPQQGHKHNAFH